MSTECCIKPFKINGKDIVVGDARLLKVRNVWNNNVLIELEVEGNTIEIQARELLKAISNVTGNEVK